MAEADPFKQSTDDTQSSSGWASAGKQVAIGVGQDIVAPALELFSDVGSDAPDAFPRRAAEIVRKGSRAIEDTIPEAHRRAAEASFFPEEGQASVLDDPLEAARQQGARFLPTVAAMVGLKRLPTQVAAGAGQQGGSFLNEVANTVERSSDEELQADPFFADLINKGMPSEYARKLLIKKRQEAAGAMTTSMVGGGVGAGFLGRAMHVPGGGSMPRAVGVGAGEGAIGVGAGSASMNIAQQLAEVESGKRSEIDWGEAARSLADGVIKGGIVGTALGTAGHMTRPHDRVATEPTTDTTTGGTEVVEGNAPDAAQTAALAATAQPNQVEPAARGGAGSEAAGSPAGALAQNQPQGGQLAAVEPPPVGEATGVRPAGLDARIAAEQARIDATLTGDEPVAPTGEPLPAAGVQAIVPPASPPLAATTTPTGSPQAAGGVAGVITSAGNTSFGLRDFLHTIASKNTQFTKIRDQVNARLADAGEKPLTDAQVRAILKEQVNAGQFVYNQKRGYRSTRPKVVQETAPEVGATPVVDPSGRSASAEGAGRDVGSIEGPVRVAEPVAMDPTVGAQSADVPPVGAKVETGVRGPAGEATPAAPVEPPKPKGPPPAPPEEVAAVVAATGQSPTSSTTQKVARKVAKAKVVLAQKETAEQIAEREANAQRAAEGKPRILKAKPTGVAAEQLAKIKEAQIREQAAAEVRRANAERMRAKRQQARGENDEKARKAVESMWDDTNPGEHNKTNQRAVTGDLKAVGDVVQRARRVVMAATEEHGVVLRDTRTGEGFGRATHTKADPDNKNVTPWVNFVRQSAIFEKVVGNALKGRMTDAALTKLRDYVEGYVRSEMALRMGDYEGAAADRLNRAAEKKAEFMVRDKDAADDVADAEPQMMAKRGAPHPIYEADIWTPEGKITSDVKAAYGAPKAVWSAINEATPESFKGMVSKQLAELRRTTVKGDLVGQRVLGVLNRLVSTMGDTKLVWVDGPTLNQRWPASGVYLKPTDEAFARGDNGLIVLNKDEPVTLHVVMHEMIHAATSRELDQNPALVADINAIMRDVKRKWKMSGEEPYGFSDAHEFLAEAMTNPDFQQALQGIELSQPLQTRWGAVKNAWSAFVRKVAQALGFTKRHEVNALEAAMLAFDEVTMHSDASRHQLAMDTMLSETLGSEEPQFLKKAAVKKWVTEGWTETKGRSSDWSLRMKRTLDKVATFTQLGNTSDDLFGAAKPARRLVEAMAKMSTDRDATIRKDAPLVRDLFTAGRKYGERFEEFQDFLIDETSAGIFADRPIDQQPHLGKEDNPSGWAARGKYDDLRARYDALPEELKELRGRLHEFFRQRQDEMSLGLINNVLKHMSDDGQGSMALAKRIHEGKLTEADKAVLGGDAAYATIKKAGALSKIAGPYVPLMRRGDFVVQGRNHVETPAGARRMTENEELTPTGNVFEFTDAQAAKRFVQNLDLPADVERVYVDPTTGSNMYDTTIDGKQVRKRLNKDETNAEERYRVTVQDKHVEYFETKQAAEKGRAALIERGVKDVADLDLRRQNASDAGANFIPTQIEGMIKALKQRTSFQNLHEGAQRELIRHLEEMGIAAMASTRAQTRRLPRTRVAGASNDITTNTQQYSGSTAGYLARLKHQPDVDVILKEMRAFTEDQRYAGNGDDTQLRRRARLQEFEGRIYDMRDPDPPGLFNRSVSRLLQISYLDKLASPAFHMINAVEPWTVSLPVIAARHGFKTLAAMQRAYSLIGGGRNVASGLRDTFRAYKTDEGLTDYASTIKDRLAKQPDGENLGRLVDHLHDVGLLSRDAGLELGRVIRPDARLVGRALDRADLMARQMGAAIESINRTVTAVAAYQLERTKGTGHEGALKYATEVVHDSMGDYNTWNAAPVFNHPIGRLALQFRKYAQKTYYLLGKQAVASFKGDKQAMRAFAGLMATHMLVAGTLGLPTEMIKIGMLAAGMLGITDRKYGDLEESVRSGAASVFGKDAGQIFTRGLPRWLGVDLAGRMGLDSLFMGQIDPKSLKPDDMYAYLAKTFAGAPVAYIMEASKGFQELAQGNVLEATRLITPLKIYADSVQAVQLAYEGRKSQTGRELMPPITKGEMITKMLGFTPGNVAEQQEKSFAIRGDQERRKKERDKLIGEYVGAKGSARTSVLKRINDWNAGMPPNAHIKFAELSGAEKRRKDEQRKGTYDKGVRYTKRDQDLKDTNAFYNTR